MYLNRQRARPVFYAYRSRQALQAISSLKGLLCTRWSLMVSGHSGRVRKKKSVPTQKRATLLEHKDQIHKKRLEAAERRDCDMTFGRLIYRSREHRLSRNG